MNRLHPALSFVRDHVRPAFALGTDTIRLDIGGTPVEVFVAPANGAAVFFAADRTRLSYRCPAGLPDGAKERVRAVLLELKERLARAYLSDRHAPVAAGGGWTDDVRPDELSAWRAWAARSYRDAIERGRRDDCAGLPDCLDLRMRPPLAPPWLELGEQPRTGPCAACGRARGCPTAAESAPEDLRSLRHADPITAEVAALHTLAEAASLPLARALEAYTLLTSACTDRALEGAIPLEYSIRLAAGRTAPDRLRFVSYYPMAQSDAARRGIHEGRREALRILAARWLGPDEQHALGDWLRAVADALPPTVGISIGLEIDAIGVRLQAYAHPSPSDPTSDLVATVVRTFGGTAEGAPAAERAPVLVGIALSAGQPPALKLYSHRSWNERGDTGLAPSGLGELEPYNPGWGLAVQEHVAGRAAWVKWDFPVTAHYQIADQFLGAFWRTMRHAPEPTPPWLSGQRFSPWPTWASVGRGGGALYFQAR